MKKIALVGCGFTGTMTAVHLIRNACQPFELILINPRQSFNRGLAYSPYSRKQILNVVASRMSAYDDNPDHFLNWICGLDDFKGVDRNILANSYLPRYLYGDYLRDIWIRTLEISKAKKIVISVQDAQVAAMEVSEDEIVLSLDNQKTETVQYCILATGNQVPRNPDISNDHFYNSPKYFRNPWDVTAVRNADPGYPLLILGNGLTMVDTVSGLIENGFSNKIYTISPHGFTILPHKHHGIDYSSMREEFQDKQCLAEILRIVNKHVRLIRKFGFSAEPVIDAIRPVTQQIWQNLTIHEKRIFMSRLRHFWDAGRHRVPMHIHAGIRHLTETGKLNQYAGKLLNISETENHIMVRFFDVQQQVEKEVVVSRVINCTGPATDLLKAEGHFLKGSLLKGTIIQDDLKLGIMANPDTFEVYNAYNQPYKNLVAIGALLKGVLWESVAVREFVY
ncbi:MAG: FAD/NAD(P)-binding protein [Bacteroidetes bacterium]|nr:FAD/NAD(P)-binding protein [Bacteroidota bacterium]